jgi:hypothetical protein
LAMPAILTLATYGSGGPNNALERAVMRGRVRAASTLVHCAPAARVMRHRTAAQRER